jgi:hypothetical protein
MSEVITNKYLSLDGLRKYDGLIKSFIESGDKVLADAIAALTNKIGSLEFEGSDDKTVAEIIDDIYSSIADIVEKQSLLDAKDAEIEGKIAEEIAKIVGSLGEGESHLTLAEIAAQLKSLGDRVTANEGEIAGVKERVDSLEAAVGDNTSGLIKAVADLRIDVEGMTGDAGSISSQINTAIENLDLPNTYEAKGYADTLVKDAEGNSLFDAAGAAATAQAAAIEAAAAGAAELYQVKGDYEAAGAAAQALADAKADAANLYQVKGDYEAAGAAAQALADAKADAANLYQVKGDYEAAGAAAQALADAKADAASLYQVKGDYEVAGTAAGLNAAMDERVVKLEAIDHEKLAADASAAAVAAIVAGAESDFDTLKEVEEWIGAHKEGAAELQTTVSGHTDSINTLSADLSTLDTKVDQDIANLTDHMSAAATALEEVDERLEVLEVFVESHGVITDAEIEGLFA